MDPKEAFDAFVNATKGLTGAAPAHHLRLVPTAHSRWELRRRFEELPAFDALQQALGAKSLADLLDRTGVFDQLVDGSADHDKALKQLMEARDRAPDVVSLLHLEGIAPFDGVLELEQGFRLVSFTADEWLRFQPQLQSEQLDPVTISRQTFLEKRDLRLTKTPKVFSSRQGLRKDPLWSGWWKPLLGLALFRPEQFSDGVRLEVEPQWRIWNEGSFSAYGEELPWGPEEDSDEVWQPYRSYEYDVGDEAERQQLTAFVCRVMRAAHRAHQRDGDRIATAAKRFLWGAFHLASHGVWRRGDHDINEQVLFNLVRAADGPFLADVERGKTREFRRRVGLACGLRADGLDGFLNRAYDARSRIAHGNTDPADLDLSALHEVIRLAFVGFFGLAEEGLQPRDLRADLPAAVRELHAAAVPGSRDPRGRNKALR